jgi:pyochelin biosynthetic protein PchC
LPDDVELWAVQYPGREERLREPLVDEMEPLVDAFLRAILPTCDRPFALFGHSMGATIAYEAVGRMMAMGAPKPLCLFVSGQCAPADHRPGKVHLRNDQGLIAELARVGGAQRLLDEPELRALVLPIVRNDYRLIETYRPGSWVLDCPVVSYGGHADPDVNPSELARWSAVTNGDVDMRTFSGDHFTCLSGRRTW